ncbi:hypothetical protein HI914_03232 [Erysiphe necator]|nr:hypothetical protein HI914_03232 [Erysiphe necator]
MLVITQKQLPSVLLPFYELAHHLPQEDMTFYSLDGEKIYFDYSSSAFDLSRFNEGTNSLVSLSFFGDISSDIRSILCAGVLESTNFNFSGDFSFISIFSGLAGVSETCFIIIEFVVEVEGIDFFSLDERLVNLLFSYLSKSAVGLVIAGILFIEVERGRLCPESELGKPGIGELTTGVSFNKAKSELGCGNNEFKIGLDSGKDKD